MWYRTSKKTQHTGGMLALFLNKESGKKLLITDTKKPVVTTEPLGNLHISLFYFLDDKPLTKSTCEFIRVILRQLQSKFIKLTATVSGIGMFSHTKENGAHALYASVNSPSIVELRNELAKIFDDVGIEYSKEFSYTPHITLADVNSMPEIQAQEFDLKFESVALCINDSKQFTIKI